PNEAADWLAKRTGGIAQSSVSEALFNVPNTAHILGGATIGHSPEDGVVDSRQRVFGYENLLVCDGAAIPANVGVNPSLTITALAEHAMSGIPDGGNRRPRWARPGHALESAPGPPLPASAELLGFRARRLGVEPLGYVVPVDDVP